MTNDRGETNSFILTMETTPSGLIVQIGPSLRKTPSHGLDQNRTLKAL